MSDDACVAAVDIGGGTTKLALVDRESSMSQWQAFSTVGATGEAFLEQVLGAVRQMIGRSKMPVAGAAVAVAGFVGEDGALAYNPNLPWLERVPIASYFRKELGVPVVVEADSNAATIAEYLFGAGRGAKRFLCLTGGTGLGVGMIAEGKLLRVAHGCLGDAGHVIVQADGPACSCGGRGCAEVLLSTAVLGQRYAELSGRPKGTFRALVQDGEVGRSAAVAMLSEAGYWLGVTAASLANVFFPDRIAVAGGLSQAGEALFCAGEKAFRGHGGKFPLEAASLVRASTGEHATLIGAAAAFFSPGIL